MEGPSVFAEPFRQPVQHLPGVFRAGKAPDEVVRIADPESPTSPPWLHVPLEPDIQQIVQVDVGQERCPDPSLRGPGVGERDAPVFQDARVEAFPEESSPHPVA